MQRTMFPLLATATFALAGLGAAAPMPANAADLLVTPQYRARVQYDYGPADRYYGYRTVEVYDEPAQVYYEEPDDDYAPPPVAYGRPVPPAPVATEYEYAPRGYYRGYAPPPPPRAVEVYDAY